MAKKTRRHLDDETRDTEPPVQEVSSSLAMPRRRA